MDYREEWLKFSEGLTLKLDINDLVPLIVNMLQNSMAVNKVSLWLGDTNTGKLGLLGPHSSAEKAQLKTDQRFLKVLLEKKIPFLLEAQWARGFVRDNSEILERFQASLVFPIVSGGEMFGLILLGKKNTGEPFMSDDIDLLRSASAQITGAIVNAQLSQELIKAKEREMFHRISSFVLHDIKNLVSSLSLVVQNAGEHMNNPQFQQDAFETIGKSVKKMEGLIARLSNNTATVKPNLQDADLNKLALEAVNRISLNDLKRKTVEFDLKKIPRVLIDREQIEKVIVNLLLNALEAINKDGSVMVKTEAHDEKVILSVMDNGCGMSPEYLENTLFKPFKSTKEIGLGIGLYQCKTIIEAHHGRIEVESEKGVGSTFRIFLPFSQEKI